MNRVQDRIDLIQRKLDSGMVTPEALDKLEKSLPTDWQDLVEYQNLQALAHASGKLSFEEANLIYNTLGRENPTEAKWDKLSVATRVAITQVMAELLDWKVKLSGRGATRSKYSTFAGGSRPGSRRPKPDAGIRTARGK